VYRSYPFDSFFENEFWPIEISLIEDFKLRDYCFRLSLDSDRSRRQCLRRSRLIEHSFASYSESLRDKSITLETLYCAIDDRSMMPDLRSYGSDMHRTIFDQGEVDSSLIDIHPETLEKFLIFSSIHKVYF
jgi:hypothetical protein